MIFLRPWILIFLCVPFLLAWLSTHTGGRVNAWKQVIDKDLLPYLIVRGNNKTTRHRRWVQIGLWAWLIVAAAGPNKKEFVGKDIHPDIIRCIEQRKTVLATDADSQFCQVTEDGAEVFSEAVATILSEGDAIGAVILLSRDTERVFGDFEEKMAICGANFLGRQMEQ